MKKSVVVYWLIPAAPERELFRTLIRILAKQFDAPRFQPHLTLGMAPKAESPRELLRELKAAPIRLRVRAVGCSAQFKKTLFVRFRSDRALHRLAGLLSSTEPRDPHVSLLYKKLPARTKRELTATIKLPFRDVTFASVKAVRCTSPTTTARDVKSWRVVATKRLSGKRTRPRVSHSAPRRMHQTHIRQ